MAHSSSKIVPNAPPNLAFSFHTSSWKGEGVKAVTSKDGVGEEEAIWIGRRAAVSAFSSLNFLFFKLAVKLDKGSFFKFMMQVYFSLLYLVAIFAK